QANRGPTVLTPSYAETLPPRLPFLPKALGDALDLAGGGGYARGRKPLLPRLDPKDKPRGHRNAPFPPPRPLDARDRHPRACAGCSGRRQFGPFRNADGHGPRGDRAVREAPEVRSQGPALARPRPLHPVGRPWLDADLCALAPDRLRGRDA